MIAYGSYGVNLPAYYRPELVRLIELGWCIAFAHVRGGGEFGPQWHTAGKKYLKWNTFKDFEACALHLIQHGIYSSTC